MSMPLIECTVRRSLGHGSPLPHSPERARREAEPGGSIRSARPHRPAGERPVADGAFVCRLRRPALVRRTPSLRARRTRLDECPRRVGPTASMMGPSDEQLMLRVRDGDLGAFEAIVVRYQTDAWRLAYRFTGDPAEAEDLAQEAFLRILDAAPRYSPTGTLRSYLYRVLTRLCLDHRRGRRPALAGPFPTELDDAPTPPQRAEEVEREAAIQEALDALPPDYRVVVVLRYFEAMSGAAIAESMGRTVKGVERLLARAKAALEARLNHLQDS